MFYCEISSGRAINTANSLQIFELKNALMARNKFSMHIKIICYSNWQLNCFPLQYFENFQSRVGCWACSIGTNQTLIDSSRLFMKEQSNFHYSFDAGFWRALREYRWKSSRWARRDSWCSAAAPCFRLQTWSRWWAASGSTRCTRSRAASSGSRSTPPPSRASTCSHSPPVRASSTSDL